MGGRLGCRGPSRGARGVCRCSGHPDFAWVQPLDLCPLYSLFLACCRASSQASSQATLILSKGRHLFACLGRGKVSFNTEHLLGVDWETLGSPLRSSEVQGSLRRTNPQGGDGPPCLTSVFSLPELNKKLERRTSKGSLPHHVPPTSCSPPENVTKSSISTGDEKQQMSYQFIQPIFIK